MGSGATFELSIERNVLPSIVGQFGKAADLGLDAWSAEMLQAAKSNSPYKTGGLRASGYRMTPVTNTYHEAAAAFTSANVKGNPAPPPTFSPSAHEAVVGFCADYAMFVNNGTRHQAANPFFTSAIEATKGKLSEHVAHYVQALCDTGHAG